MNRAVGEAAGAVLVVPQFTLYGDCRKGRRPSYVDAAPPEEADRLFRHFAGRLRASGLHVAEGVFRADMDVSLVNRGPVTLLLDSRKAF
jgi:D-tyrosyl-tRNA(Tyr) deacylase